LSWKDISVYYVNLHNFTICFLLIIICAIEEKLFNFNAVVCMCSLHMFSWRSATL